MQKVCTYTYISFLSFFLFLFLHIFNVIQHILHFFRSVSFPFVKTSAIFGRSWFTPHTVFHHLPSPTHTNSSGDKKHEIKGRRTRKHERTRAIHGITPCPKMLSSIEGNRQWNHLLSNFFSIALWLPMMCICACAHKSLPSPPSWFNLTWSSGSRRSNMIWCHPPLAPFFFTHPTWFLSNLPFFPLDCPSKWTTKEGTRLTAIKLSPSPISHALPLVILLFLPWWDEMSYTIGNSGVEGFLLKRQGHKKLGHILQLLPCASRTLLMPHPPFSIWKKS